MTERIKAARREDLLALVERVEKATGPDRRLDARIGAAVSAMPQSGDGGWLEEWPRPFEPARFAGSIAATDGKGGTVCHWEARAYTASLDAAMTLVPEGQAVELATGAARLSDARVDWKHPGLAKTPALALTAAALRAHAAKGSE